MNLAAAALAVLAGFLGLTQYLQFKTRRQRQTEVGKAFSNVVAGLGSDSGIERLASAILLRRFFDRGSEHGQAGTPYAADAIRVMSAVLRTEPTGPVQKLLGDGLASAPTLAYADLQRTNLRNCYWGRTDNRPRLHAERVDLFGADLTKASLRGADLRHAPLVDATLVDSVLREADCRGANFNRANLSGASFEGALLAGATFHAAVNIPAQVAKLIDGEGNVESLRPVPTTSSTQREDSQQTPRRVFISSPSALDELDAAVLDQVGIGIADADCTPVRHLPRDYNRADPTSGILKVMSACDAVLIFGAPQVRVVEALWCRGDEDNKDVKDLVLGTPWNQVEAGMAVALNKPMLVIRRKSSGGVFDLMTNPPDLEAVDLDELSSLRDLAPAIKRWCDSV